MKLYLRFGIGCLVLLALALTSGCKKQEAAPVATNAVPAAAMAPESPAGGPPVTPPAPKPAIVQQNPDINATLGQLALELRKYVVRTRSVPKTFEEFIAKSGVQAPPPPPGKRYAIEGQQVVLK